MNPIAGRAPLPHAGSSAAWGGLEEKDEEGDGASVHHGAPPLQPGQHMGEEEWHASIRHAPPLDTHAPRPPLAQAFPSMTSFRTAHGVPPSPSGASLSSPLGQSHTASSPAHTASPSRPRSSWRAKLASAVKVALRSTHKEDEASEQGSVAGGSHVYAGAGGGAPLESERGRAPAPAPRPLYTLDDSGRGVFALVRRGLCGARTVAFRHTLRSLSVRRQMLRRCGRARRLRLRRQRSRSRSRLPQPRTPTAPTSAWRPSWRAWRRSA